MNRYCIHLAMHKLFSNISKLLNNIYNLVVVLFFVLLSVWDFFYGMHQNFSCLNYRIKL
uniref:Uncharacterized protein n=1 Tax=Arundo donax TaxID=35708 RepID=A0A0A9CVM4_ARUDO